MIIISYILIKLMLNSKLDSIVLSSEEQHGDDLYQPAAIPVYMLMGVSR